MFPYTYYATPVPTEVRKLEFLQKFFVVANIRVDILSFASFKQMPTSKHSELPKHLSLKESYAVYRPTAEVILAEAVKMVDRAIAYCRENAIAGLLLDIRGLSGFGPPSVFDRFSFSRQWAETGAGHVVVATIAPAEMIDPDKIGVTVAVNRGLESEVFTSESEAVEWLRERC